MSFAQFQQALISPALKNVAAHWNDVRAARPMPAWSDIKPSAIAAQLPIVWCYRYDWETDTFVGRLAGEQISRLLGRAFHGLPMSEAYPAEEYRFLFERQRKVIRDPCLARSHGLVFRHLDRVGRGERIVLPLSDAGDRADCILGATEYQMVQRPLSQETIEAGDTWEWFPLG
jgi:hypothetical protein